MKYVAHVSEDKSREQTVKDHLEGTAERARDFADAFGYGEWGYCAGMMHDIGKYTKGFQKRILANGNKVDHSTAGAQVCWKKGNMYQFLSYCIAGHHAGLPNTGFKTDTDTTMYGRSKKVVEDFSDYEKEIKFPELTKMPIISKDPKKRDFVFSLFIRMIFSCLVDADYLDTEFFMKDGQVERNQNESSMEELRQKLNEHISQWLNNKDLDTINGRRTQILKSCLEKGRSQRGLFRLTVPTGGGKTIASLAFALEHAVENKIDRIIYVIPYTSIIEQNAEVFRSILGFENVLEDHCNVDYESREELRPMQLAAENWDKPVVVTTNVQFFESLFSNRASKCRKLHNIANSVIIFDEAQMLPNDYLKPCVEIMEELVQYYNSTIVLCTATQPALQSFFSKELLCQELCPDVELQFEFFKRTNIKNLGVITEEELASEIERREQALCILNTRKQVQRLYQKIKGEGVFHLSTTMYPVHRKRVLQQIRECLNQGEKCIVVATSLVEAGVDLDFQAVYRQVAGIDSIIQAAGRCNREGKQSLESSCTFVFQMDEEKIVKQQELPIAVTKQILQDKEDLSSLDAIQQYFENLYHFRGESLDKKEIMEAFHKCKFPFADVSKDFKIIEENTRTILVTYEERAKQIEEEIRIKGMTKALMREAGQYCISVHENIFKKMYEEGMIRAISEDLKEDFFALSRVEDYTEDMGLLLDIESGRAILF